MTGLSFKAAQQGFFDRAKVINAVNRAARRNLSRFGAFVRTRAKTSIRKRQGPSAPGKPPHSHVGLLRNLIFFAWDSARRAVVIGPVLISNPTGAPENLEYGGEADMPIGKGKTKRVTIKRRAYMGPAFDAEKPGLMAMWADSVR